MVAVTMVKMASLLVVVNVSKVTGLVFEVADND